MKKLPTSVENFRELIKRDYYYVDKTMLIEDIVELSGKIKLITRPRRFGKTLNMDMMLRFFSMDEKEDLFTNLKIWNEKGIVQEHYHKYPVIYISFKSIKEQSWQEARNTIVELVSELAQKHIDLDVSDITKEKIMQIAKRKAGLSLYKKSLQLISQALYEERGIMPIILIDEYDVPIESAYLNRNKDPEYYDNMIDFMRVFLTSALKGSDTYFSFAVLTGVYRIAKESIFSGLNNLAVYTVFDNPMSDKFGFTEDELINMLEYYGLNEEDKEIIDKWYGNYKIGKTQNLYNPWSIVNYIASRTEGELSPKEATQKYWINTSENKIIIEQIEGNEEIKSEIDELLQKKEIITSVDTSLSLREMEEDETAVWVLFANSGYLNARWVDIGRYAFWIPNEEIMIFFKESVLRWINKKTKVRVKKLYDYLDEMLRSGRYENFVEGLRNFLENGLSYYDVARNEAERFYKGFLLGILAIAGYIVESEMESGYGRLDVVVYPKDKSYGQYAAIFEVKKSDNEKELEEKAEEALLQIKERKYYSKMQKLGYKVIGFGIAFCGKKVEIQVDTL